MKVLKSVIFDLDGIIVSTDLLHRSAWQEICRNYNLIYDEQCAEATKGVNRKQSLLNILKINGMENAFDRSALDSICYEKNEIYRSLLQEVDESFIIDGFVQLYNILKQKNYKMGIASSSENAQYILRAVGLSNSFSAIVTGNDITHSKPHPEVFNICAGLLRMPNRDCIILEDSLSGLQAAHNAGILSIYIGNDVVCSDYADFTFSNLIALLSSEFFT